jgi:hypothetical protein
MVHIPLRGRVARAAGGALVHNATRGQVGFLIESQRSSRNVHIGVQGLDQILSHNTQVTCER